MGVDFALNARVSGSSHLAIHKSSSALPPNKRLHPTPLRVDKIVAILASRCTRTTSRSIGAARVKRRALGGPQGRRCHKGRWFMLRAISPLPRPPRAAPPHPIPHYPAPRFPTIPRAAKSLALVSARSNVRSAGRPTRHSSGRRCAAQTRRPFCRAISTPTWSRCIMAAQLSGNPLDGNPSSI